MESDISIITYGRLKYCMLTKRPLHTTGRIRYDRFDYMMILSVRYCTVTVLYIQDVQSLSVVIAVSAKTSCQGASADMCSGIHKCCSNIERMDDSLVIDIASSTSPTHLLPLTPSTTPIYHSYHSDPPTTK